MFVLLGFLLLGACSLTLDASYAQETDSLGFAKAEFYMRQKQYELALREFGRLGKNRHEDPLFRQHVEWTLEALKRPQGRHDRAASVPGGEFTHQVRVVRRQYDATQNADQRSDDRGWQVNESLSGLKKNPEGVSTRLVMDLDGYKDGHNDARYRTLLADFFRGNSHLGVGDSATYTSPYFLRASRLRGIDWIIKGPANEFQMVAGAYPVWLESRDEYIYPRTVWGIRDKYNLIGDRLRVGAGIVQTRDNQKIRTEDGANPQARVDPVFQPRDNTVFNLDQEVKIIEDIWFLKAAESYSYTDDNLLEDRFGDNTKLKDFACQAESLLIQPLFRWRGRYLRTGPDYRLLGDLPQGAVNGPKDVQADVERIEQLLDLTPVGPFDLDLEATWARNDLDRDDTVEQTRQSWYTADLGIETPAAWPHPRLRGTYFETISVPGTTTRPSQTRTYEVSGELQQFALATDWTAFSTYEVEHPVKDKVTFDEEDRFSVGVRAGRPLGERLHVNSRYQYLAFDELFDESRQRGIRHEADAGGSLRLWSTATLSANYTFLHGQLSEPGSTKLAHGQGHAATVNFTWPYKHLSFDKRRKWSVLPGITYHLTDLSQDLEQKSLVTGRLSVGYELLQEWRLELLGEYRYEYDNETSQDKTAGLRMWLLWTSRFGN